MIGYYAHSHGRGHSNYANLFAVAAAAMHAPGGRPLTIFTETDFAFDPGARVVRLEKEVPDQAGFLGDLCTTPDYLHHAPIGEANVTRRNLQILLSIVQRAIRLCIVDVSAEIAALLRTSGVAYAFRRMMGDRSDPAHQMAYRGALFLLAYYPEALEPRETPAWIRAKTVYLGFQAREPTTHMSGEAPPTPAEGFVLVLLGFGGHDWDGAMLDELADRFAPEEIWVVGRLDERKRARSHSRRVRFFGVVPDPSPFIEAARLVIGPCGTNTVSEVLERNKPFLTTPADRPFGEQRHFAEILEERRLAPRFDSNDLERRREFAERCAATPRFRTNADGIPSLLATLEAANYEPRRIHALLQIGSRE